MPTPIKISPPYNSKVCWKSLMAFNCGNWLSAQLTMVNTSAIAMLELISPLMMALMVNGLIINPRVAPTICMVLIKKRLLNMASLMVLSILMITMEHKIMATTKNMSPILEALSLRLVTKLFGYWRSVSWLPYLAINSVAILLNESWFTYSALA